MRPGMAGAVLVGFGNGRSLVEIGTALANDLSCAQLGLGDLNSGTYCESAGRTGAMRERPHLTALASLRMSAHVVRNNTIAPTQHHSASYPSRWHRAARLWPRKLFVKSPAGVRPSSAMVLGPWGRLGLGRLLDFAFPGFAFLQVENQGSIMRCPIFTASPQQRCQPGSQVRVHAKRSSRGFFICGFSFNDEP